MKTCNICKILKNNNEFEYQTNSKDKLSASCKGCLHSARSKGAYKIPDGAICNPKRMSRKILNYDFENVPLCYHELIHEQRKLRVEMERLI